jgi:hypothetical protein
MFTLRGTTTLGGGASAMQISTYALSHRDVLALGMLGECVLALSLIFFAALLRHLSAERSPTLGLIGFGAAIASATLVLVAVAAGIGIVELVPAADAGSISTLWILLLACNRVQPMPVSLLMGVTAAAIVARSALPAWTGWFSAAASIATFLNGLDIYLSVTAYANAWPFVGTLPALSALWAFVLSGALLIATNRARAG